ncbi:MAG: alpha-rhamnosidase, partial [Bacteroidaceae bacterium]|nr:alpha-rhamnosidase [Bacteroidaceae bacterium]
DNHMMFGEIGAWFYKGIGGIFPDPENPGFKHVIFKPNFPVALTRFEANHESPYGEIISKWERKGKRIQYTVKIPANSSATLTLPACIKDAKDINLEAGEHTIMLRLK